MQKSYILKVYIFFKGGEFILNLLFTLNKNYIHILKNCIKSLLRFKAQEKYSIYIMHSDLTENETNDLKSSFPSADFSFIYMDKELFSDFPENKRYPKEMYYRIFAADFLPQTMDKVLYLDPDIIVINPIDEFYSRDLGDNFYMACSHTRKFLTKVNMLRLGVDEDYPYINSGVMLMNLKELRKHQKKEEILSYINDKGKNLILPDQDIITALYGGKTIIADSLKYNMSDRLLSFHNASPANKKIDLDWIRKNTVIIHYFGKNKPWKENYKGILDCFYKEIENSNY